MQDVYGELMSASSNDDIHYTIDLYQAGFRIVTPEHYDEEKKQAEYFAENEDFLI